MKGLCASLSLDGAHVGTLTLTPVSRTGSSPTDLASYTWALTEHYPDGTETSEGRMSWVGGSVWTLLGRALAVAGHVPSGRIKETR